MKPITFSLTPADFKKETLVLTIDDSITGLLALASGLDDDNSEWESEREWEAVKYVLDNFDFESAYIQHLNTTMHPCEGLKGGAWLALNNPEAFATALKVWKAEQWDAITDHNACECEELEEETAKASDCARVDCWKEWLHGDNRNWEGLESKAGKDIFGDSDIFSELAFDFVNVTFTADFIADRNDADDCIYTAETLKAYAVETISYTAHKMHAKRKAEHEARATEWKRTQAYKTEREAKAEAERIAKLKDMKA
jgi:hypothetical protein